MTFRYTIYIPGKLYTEMIVMDVFGEDADKEAAAAFHSATRKPKGRGLRHIVTGDKRTVETVLACIASLVAEVDEGKLKAYELGVELADLRRVSVQPLLPAV